MKIISLIAAFTLMALPMQAQQATDQPADATAELTAKAESGDAEAMRQLYSQYAVDGNTEQAQAWASRYEQQLTSQAEAGDTKAMMLLATGYLSGRDYMPQDSGKAVPWLVRAAEAGMPSAAYILGEIFTQMNNSAEAARFYKQAYDTYATLTAKLSEPPTDEQRKALYWQGYMKLMGLGTEQNTAEGIALLQSADIDWAWAQLYKCYVKGIGVEQDIAKGISYARRLADDAGDSLMAWVVGSAYLNGEGVAKDEALGRKYLQMADEANIAQAVHLNGTLLLAEGKVKEAWSRFIRAASMGLPESMTAAARIMMTGADGVEQDVARALNMLNTASDRYHDPRAPWELGQYYDSVDEPELANAQYKIASDRGVIEAMARRGLLHITPNSGVSWSPTQMYRWWRTGSEAGDPTCTLYLNLFLFGFIPLVLILAFGVPILVVHHLNKKAQQQEEAEAKQADTDK